MTTPRRLFAIALTSHGRGFALTAATILLVLHALAEAAVPVIVGATIDHAVLPVDPGALILWLAALIGTFLALTTSYQTASRLMVTVYGHGEQALRHLTLSRLLRPRLSRRSVSAGEALTYVSADTYRVAGVAWSVAQQCASVAAIVGTALVMLAISPVATVVVFASTIAMMFVMKVVSRPIERRGAAEQEAATEAGAIAADFMSGFRVLVGIGARDEAVRRYVAASDASRRAATVAARSLAASEAVSGVLAGVVTATLAAMSGWFAAEGRMSIGELVTVLGLAQFLSGYLADAGSFPANWIHKLASARRLADLIDADDLLEQSPAGAAAATPADDIALRFQPEGSASTSIEVRRGELLGIRPPDSETARALSRLLGLRTRPAIGAIALSIDGVLHDARTLDPLQYRRHVVAPPHTQTIESGTLRDAVLGHGSGRAPRTELIEIAALDDTVARVGGWDAQVGEAGRRLSGGQRQRVGLARALHAEADVVVLDEPTSAVDALTEDRIARALSRHTATTIVITSSPLLLASCDRVIHLPGIDQGRRDD
ncbi:ABC-type multidrug transport system fused ATPase/permease subunit [Microbacterium sp. SORGH_AS 1204]|uniref:ABC transporter transmembrane domain-containing protein n=1 Tax=Microbacterium sp. SORGH_AS_1204 TaxID=3041785 RepID=UPI0027901C40|nr:ABC transporter ATP-binding protein [Microbacterium sp. SORGH_AS_1204]MDQ1135905.1 ABC-type multidrug transport system fused ATPase/permease subunit [Microbacterium sp. SORGH_AS_1204]